MTLPVEIESDLGQLIEELGVLGIRVTEARFDPDCFGNYFVSLRACRLSFRITRDRGKYMLDGPIQAELQAADLWRAYSRKEEFTAAVLEWIRGWQ